MSKKIKIVSRTSTEPINQAMTVVPNAPLFEIVNTGNVMMYIDNIPYYPGERFGVDSSLGALLAVMSEKDFEIVDLTEYNVTFGSVVVDTVLYGNDPFIRATLRRTKYSRE